MSDQPPEDARPLATASAGSENEVTADRLRRSEERYQAIFESSRDAIMTVAPPTWHFTSGNPASLQMFGARDEAHLASLSPAALSPERQPDGRLSTEKAQEMIETAMREGSHSFEWLHRRYQGGDFLATVLFTKIEVSDVSMLQGTVRDITERRRTEVALRESEDTFRAIGMATLDAILMMDTAGRISFWNAAAGEMFGYTADEAIGKNLHEILVPERFIPAHRKAFPHFQKTGEGPAMGKLLELSALKKDHSEFPVEMMVSPVKRNEEWHAVGIIRDITKRKQAEEEKEKLQKQLLQSQKMESIGTLASGVAHEINNPLNIVGNFAELILDDVEADSAVARSVNTILKATTRISTIVRNLLAFAREEKTGHSPARIADLVEGTISLIRKVLEGDQIKLHIEVGEDLPRVICRSQQIQQVLTNLLTNARDALNARYPGHDQDKVVRILAKSFVRDGESWVRITVENHGESIPDEAKERIFDPFFTTKPRDVGTGLGLSVSHGIVKEHRGEIGVESEEGGWTRFHVDLRTDNGWSLGQDPPDPMDR